MDLQAKKIYFIQEFLRLNDEPLIDKLNSILKRERKMSFERALKPMSQDELERIIDRAEEDAANGRLTSTIELDKEIDSWA
ncbi:MAG: hypothetical protein K9H64_15945 [Bacteroidales bacterium]|nr:hypothetical protein [Bacteroidales bacterium]MCF8457461.1 hypothetical protein [Bacteroidales bacterium]